MQGDLMVSKKDEEVDLQELVRVLWGKKAWILIFTLLSVLFAAAFAFLSKPEYEAKGYVVPPTQKDIENFNYGRTKDSQLTPYTIKDVYGVFISYFQAESLRQDFFNNVYLPSLSEEERQGAQDGLYSGFSKRLSITLPGKDFPDRYSITVRSESPAQSVEWVHQYVARASDLAKQELLANVRREAEVGARNVEQQIAALRNVSQKEREDSIVRLQEALQVAEALGLEKPLIITGNSAIEVAGNIAGQPVYMRGAKALKAEIENMELRKSDDPFISRLRELQGKYDFYKGIEVKVGDVSVYRMDGGIARYDTPVKPVKSMILALGLLIGLVGSSGLVLVVYLIARGRSAVSS
ncbi:Wzz/FepE/Etk N-terminal domain-containing protein [Pseudomonas chlororaphis]|uniref:LPS O-antigen chain length determinant protein WzzB n=1 Tax=Pseudomonas chlororaphis TaxID=587753 RepID=UPI000E0C70CA|nr:Wzz/FepE/Etk N-terminal domain-containing protein [Pseudomonas chlororaphis]AZD17189.1 diguanylate cyclase/phosphodiesterase [Pseudomonas chlororaphis]WDH45770.1 Wzz/FepE/Etk N-terminal domain-containing protein [Pseudomonas chlororaphis]WDH57617.1 Wzz/FepE/Etk N-terminal domain-containing protein [Pseudomonas chlororaphis]WQE16874.1 Wzz/FepE/Etk N-terminal domain-containing protein [Pseudomonas chlororaphis]